MAERFDIVHVVRRQDDGDAAFAVKTLHEISERQFRYRVESDRRLVEKQQDRGPMEKRTRQIASHSLVRELN